MWPSNRILDLFDIQHPIILSPMAGSGDHALAAAVSNAGGLGSLPCAGLSVEKIKQEVSLIRETTRNPINLNFFCHSYNEYTEKAERSWLEKFTPYLSELGIEPALGAAGSNKNPFSDEHCALVEELRPKVVSFHFGLPETTLLQRVKAAGCKVISSANTVEEALWLERAGCDAVIAQGTEAGGHRGMFLSKSVAEQAGTFALLPQVVDAVNIPVIAAGGVADGRAIAAAFALGASAVQIGTAYLFTDESLANDMYRSKLKGATDNNTVITNVFSGKPARGFATRLTRDLGPITDTPMDFPMGYGVLAQFKAKAEAEGSTEFSSYLAGQAAALGRRESASELTNRLINEAEEVFSKLSSG
ncbi:NAD(P)H-dependent flavin oxidoreductase [Sneathiella glossodoripedis]|uniref:NAD(P)H-dependent flavin oxidoreductase n=1 Tax=Sneathiella glossodoripedis TaxID=418853 RepID=UPI000472760D|nr:nitronate monooxygenase [Sneathiella glossodoripedis]